MNSCYPLLGVCAPPRIAFQELANLGVQTFNLGSKGDLHFQRRIDIPSRSVYHLPLRLLQQNGSESNSSTNPKFGVHFINPPEL
jgi:hypothetical protein